MSYHELPGRYLRSKRGVLAEAVRTKDGTYKLWYGEHYGNGRFEAETLLANAKRWYATRPRGLRRRPGTKTKRKES